MYNPDFNKKSSQKETTNNEQQGQQGKTETKAHFKVTQTKKLAFEQGSGFVAGQEIKADIFELMSSTFSDFYGCKVLVNPQFPGQCQVDLYFTASRQFASDDDDRAFVTINEAYKTEKTDSVARYQQSSRILRSKGMYQMTDYGKEVLADLFPIGKNQKINWPDYVREEVVSLDPTQPVGIYTPNYSAQRTTTYAVVTVPITQIIYFIYSRKNEKGHSVVREIRPVMPLSFAGNNMMQQLRTYNQCGYQYASAVAGDEDWLWCITELDSVEVQAVAKKCGFIAKTNSGIYTGATR